MQTCKVLLEVLRIGCRVLKIFQGFFLFFFSERFSWNVVWFFTFLIIYSGSRIDYGRGWFLYHEAQGELFGKLLEEDFWLCIRLLIVCFVRVFILERLQNWMYESIHFLFFYKAFLKAPVMIPSSKQRLSLDK